MALTYYGRWSYKFEEAARREARACFIIHTSETAGDRIVGLTPNGCGTVELLHMNDEDRRELRWAAFQIGN